MIQMHSQSIKISKIFAGGLTAPPAPPTGVIHLLRIAVHIFAALRIFAILCCLEDNYQFVPPLSENPAHATVYACMYVCMYACKYVGYNMHVCLYVGK